MFGPTLSCLKGVISGGNSYYLWNSTGVSLSYSFPFASVQYKKARHVYTAVRRGEKRLLFDLGSEVSIREEEETRMAKINKWDEKKKRTRKSVPEGSLPFLLELTHPVYETNRTTVTALTLIQSDPVNQWLRT